MSDVFGLTAVDYSHIRALQDAGLWDEQQRALGAESGFAPHNFNALQRSPRELNRAEVNAQAQGYVTNNLQAIQSMMEEILYTEFRLPEYIPIVTDVPEGAVTYAYRVIDRAGLGQFIDNDGTSAPSAMAGVRLVPYPLHYAGIIPEWTMEDLRRSMVGGVALDTEVVRAATTGAMDHIETVGLEGDTDRQLKGLTNLATTGTDAVTYSGPTNRTAWSGRTAESIRTEVTDAIKDIIETTSEVFGRTIRSGLTIYLPITQFNTLTSDPIGDNVDKAIWDYIKTRNAWSEYTGEMPMLKSLLELKGAGAEEGGSATDRMIIAVNDRRVFEMAIPISPRILTTLNRGYSICAPMEYKISGLNVKRPKSIHYYDGI